MSKWFSDDDLRDLRAGYEAEADLGLKTDRVAQACIDEVDRLRAALNGEPHA